MEWIKRGVWLKVQQIKQNEAATESDHSDQFWWESGDEEAQGSSGHSKSRHPNSISLTPWLSLEWHLLQPGLWHHPHTWIDPQFWCPWRIGTNTPSTRSEEAPTHSSWGWRGKNQSWVPMYCHIMGRGSGAPVILLQIILFPQKQHCPYVEGARTSNQQATIWEYGAWWFFSSPTVTICQVRPAPLTTRVQTSLCWFACQTRGHQEGGTFPSNCGQR